MAFIKIDDNNRITAASYDYHCGDGELEVTIPDEIFIENIHDYLYKDGEFIYEPVPVEIEEIPSKLDELEAQIIYTAIETGTLLEV